LFERVRGLKRRHEAIQFLSVGTKRRG
jgi:hypothetical protein